MFREPPAKTSNLYRVPDNYIPDAKTLKRWQDAVTDGLSIKEFKARFTLDFASAKKYALRAGVDLGKTDTTFVPRRASSDPSKASKQVINSIAKTAKVSLAEATEMTAKGLRRCHMLRPAHWGHVRKGQTYCDECLSKRAESKDKTAP